jgi:hypothetical protein
MGNSPKHSSKMVKVKLFQTPVHMAPCSPCSPYSANLALSDFFLFGYLTEKILSLEFTCADDLVDWIKAEFERTSAQFLRQFLRVGSVLLKNAFNTKMTTFLKIK